MDNMNNFIENGLSYELGCFQRLKQEPKAIHLHILEDLAVYGRNSVRWNAMLHLHGLFGKSSSDFYGILEDTKKGYFKASDDKNNLIDICTLAGLNGAEIPSYEGEGLIISPSKELNGILNDIYMNGIRREYREMAGKALGYTASRRRFHEEKREFPWLSGIENALKPIFSF